MENKKWVAGWGCSISVIGQKFASYAKDMTARYVIFPTVDGEAVRLHFSNEYNLEDSTITKAVVARHLKEENIDPATNAFVTFDGRPGITIPAGGTAVSDPLPFPVRAGEKFCVSLYFGELIHVYTGHGNTGIHIEKYAGIGDWAAAEAIPENVLLPGAPYVMLNTIDFLCDEKVRAIVAFGDSITSQPWPDYLAHRLYEEGIRDISIIRKGISGGRVLSDYEQEYLKNFGRAGIKRFERDICHAGVEKVFVLHGINDIIHPQFNDTRWYRNLTVPTAEEIIEGYKKYIEIARRHGIRIYFGLLIPCARMKRYPDDREPIRQALNDWIRQAPIDGIIDFESAVWNPDNHLEMLPEYDKGDHLHPSDLGHKKMADSIPLELITE